MIQIGYNTNFLNQCKDINSTREQIIAFKKNIFIKPTTDAIFKIFKLFYNSNDNMFYDYFFDVLNGKNFHFKNQRKNIDNYGSKE